MVWTLLYTVTGAAQPLMVDHLNRHGFAPPGLLWPVLANFVGMALVAPLHATLTGDKWRSPTVTRRTLVEIVLLDASSAVLLTYALLHCGARTFTVATSSCALFVSILGACGPRGRSLKLAQWLAILCVTAGLALYATEGKDKNASGPLGKLGAGALFALLGSVGHSGMFVCADRALTAHGDLSPFALASIMGASEAALVIVFNAGMLARRSAFLPMQHGGATVGIAYALLVAVDAAHALAFFATLGHRGATAASLLKGVQVVSVFGVTSLLCDVATGQGCATPQKGAGVLLVVFGLACFHRYDKAPSPEAAEGAPASLSRSRSKQII